MNWSFSAWHTSQTSSDEGGATPVRVGEVMTGPPLVVREDATLAEVAARLLEANAGAALVVDAQGQARGLITEADFANREHYLQGTVERARHMLEMSQMRSGLQGLCASAGRRHVADLMGTYIPTAREDEPVTDAIARMMHDDVSHLPVVRRGKVVGLIARRYVLHLIAHASTTSPATRPTSREG
jgi:CBS domain-containing protein